MSNFTHGGLPAEQAWKWEEKTYQMLGAIVFKLMSGNSEMRRKAHSDYWELKRHFMKEDFESYIESLDKYRVERGFNSVQKMIIDAGKEIVLVEPFPEVVPDVPVVIPSKENILTHFHVAKKVDVVEQMALELF